MAQETDTILQAKEIVNNGFLQKVPISNRFDYSLLAPHIKSAEKRFLLENSFISQEFYDDLKSKVVNKLSNYNSSIGPLAEKYNSGGATPLPAYETLYKNYLQEFISYAVLFEALPFLHIKLGSAGVGHLDGNMVQPVSLGTLKYLRDEINDRAARLKDSMRDFLCENKNNYSLWGDDNAHCGECDDSDNLDDTFTNSLGIHFY